MRKTGVKRIRGGKTLKIDLELKGDRIVDIVISGDFFAHPEEAIDELERELKGSSIDDITFIVNKFRDRIELVGLSIDDILELLLELTR